MLVSVESAISRYLRQFTYHPLSSMCGLVGCNHVLFVLHYYITLDGNQRRPIILYCLSMYIIAVVASAGQHVSLPRAGRILPGMWQIIFFSLLLFRRFVPL